MEKSSLIKVGAAAPTTINGRKILKIKYQAIGLIDE
jgi:hypothetical protein